jgi:hypothetical protein
LNYHYCTRTVRHDRSREEVNASVADCPAMGQFLSLNLRHIWQ